MIDGEKTFLDEVQRFLENKGCLVYREIIPDECLLWEKPYRVDMIIFRQDIGYIGIEGKYLNTLGQGAILAQASEQIKKYRNLTYFKGLTKINRWAILPKFSRRFIGKDELTTLENDLTIFDFIKGFFKFWDIDVANYFESRSGWSLSIGANFPKSICFNKWCNGLKKEGDNDKGI